MSLPNNTSFLVDFYDFAVPRPLLCTCIVSVIVAFLVNLALLIATRINFPKISDPYDGPIQIVILSNTLQFLLVAVVIALTYIELIPINDTCHFLSWIIHSGSIFGKKLISVCLLCFVKVLFCAVQRFYVLRSIE